MSKEAPHVGLARKHRPQLFEDIVGQESVAVTLRNAVDSGQPAHAYLFFGPKGVGKTTTARILAKALNCAKGPTPEPCGKCPSCQEIASGSSIDVLELDAASNTQVDKIREMIIETVALAPSRDRRKIFIVDEVHMLSTSSFNALLKTLEEPPPHALFILATTELAKIPATIVSRCQRFRFRPVPREETAAYLARVAKAEKVKAEPEALSMMARAAGGSLRDAVSLLDQAAAYGDGAVTAAGVAELMGALPEDLLLGVAEAVLGRDPKRLSEHLARAAAEGVDHVQILKDLRERFHEAYLHRLGLAGDLPEGWRQAAASRSPETFAFLVKRLNRALADLRGAESPQMTFELAIYGLLEPAQDLAGWVSRLEALERGLASGQAAAPAPAAPASAPSPAPAAAPADGDPAALWRAALDRLQETKPVLTAALDTARMEPAGGSEWRVVFANAFSRDRAEPGRAAVEEALSGLAGRAIRLVFSVEASPAPSRKQAPPSGRRGEAWVDSSEGEASDDPNVRKVLGVLGGRVKQAPKKPG